MRSFGFISMQYRISVSKHIQILLHKLHIGVMHVCTVDLMPSVNDFLVLFIIPVLDYIVYPHLEKTMGVKIRPLHKVHVVNSFVKIWAFLYCSFVTIMIAFTPQHFYTGIFHTYCLCGCMVFILRTPIH